MKITIKEVFLKLTLNEVKIQFDINFHHISLMMQFSLL